MNTHRNAPGGKLIVTASLLAVTALAINVWPAMAVAGGPNDDAAGTIAAVSTSTISMSGTTLIIDGGAADNDIREHSGWPQHIIDTSGVTAGPGCEQVNPTEVYCPDPVNVTYLNVSANLGDGNDKLDAWGVFCWKMSLDAGNGNDEVYGCSGADEIKGGAGNDDLRGGPGDDTLDGESGDDTLLGGSGSDSVTGGPGLDSVDGDDSYLSSNGNDRLYLVDGEQDQAACGFGADIVKADSIDVVEEVSCESITRVEPAPGTTPPPATGPAAVTGVKAVVKKGKAKVTWQASSGATSYKVRYSKPGAKKYRAWKNITALKFKFTVRKGAKYAVQIIPIGPAGSGPTQTKRFKVK